MRLAEFILANREPILTEWETFARSCRPASRTMNIEALRDHANAMLTVIAADLATPQSERERAAKSRGQGHAADPDAETAAEAHGAGRAESGFTVEQMVAEYRALRASVIRLWTSAGHDQGPAYVEDLTRFNEAVDQSLAESVARYNENVEQAKDLFIAILGHDLRSPLGAISTSAMFMLETGELEEPHRTLTSRIAASAKRTVGMVGDLLDFTRGRLGGGIPIERKAMSLGKVIHDVADEIAATHPARHLRIESRGKERGCWDAARLGQAFANLIGNAVQHGAAGGTVTIELRGEDTQVAVSVHNRGIVIPPEQLDGIFQPMKMRQSAERSATGATGSLGLGLYIAELIVHAHGGRVEVESTEERGTTFTVYLPYDEPQASPL